MLCYIPVNEVFSSLQKRSITTESDHGLLRSFHQEPRIKMGK